MSTEVILSLITILASIISGVMGWLFGRRKQNAKAVLLETQGIDAMRQFYETILNDINKRLQEYIQLSTKNRSELHQLRQVVDILIDEACLRIGCNKRIFYSSNTRDSILKHSRTTLEENKFNFNIQNQDGDNSKKEIL